MTNGLAPLKLVPFKTNGQTRRKHAPIRIDGAHQSQICSC